MPVVVTSDSSSERERAQAMMVVAAHCLQRAAKRIRGSTVYTKAFHGTLKLVYPIGAHESAYSLFPAADHWYSHGERLPFSISLLMAHSSSRSQFFAHFCFFVKRERAYIARPTQIRRSSLLLRNARVFCINAKQPFPLLVVFSRKKLDNSGKARQRCKYRLIARAESGADPHIIRM